MKARARRVQSRQRTLGLEQLESRMVLDGNVQAFISGGSLDIRGDAADNQILIEQLQLDTIILVDGGTDSLMRGDEAKLGTPEEDMASIAAVTDSSTVP